MKNQEQYDRAIELLEELEEILGGPCLTVDGYDGYDPRDELWLKFATEEELAERREKARAQWEEWNKNVGTGIPLGELSARTALWAEQQLLQHAQPLTLLKFLEAANDDQG